MILTIEINTTKDDPMLVDKALGRIYTIDGVEDVRLLDTGIEELEQENRLLRARNERLEGGNCAKVSPLEFVTMVMEKEHLVGKPLIWAEWPNKEKNT